jgi:hypothetical protein
MRSNRGLSISKINFRNPISRNGLPVGILHLSAMSVGISISEDSREPNLGRTSSTTQTQYEQRWVSCIYFLPALVELSL